MKPISIINSLNESSKYIEKIKKLPDWIKEKLIDGEDSVEYWYCDNCDKYFEEPYSEEVNLEVYYGVGSDFPDSHYGSIIMCPNCKGDLHEESVNIDTIIDYVIDDGDLYQAAMEILEELHPEITGEYYRQQGTHHCDMDGLYECVDGEIIREMLGRGIL